jgi:hypothetical protein
MQQKISPTKRYIFSRDLYINDPDPSLCIPKKERELSTWPEEIDGCEVTSIAAENEKIQWYVGHFRVNPDWCKEVPSLTLVK